MKNILIYGTTEFSKELRFYIENDSSERVLAYVLDKQYIDKKSFDDKPIIAYEDLKGIYSKEDIEIIISLGYSKMNDNRKKIFVKCMDDGWKVGSFIHSSVSNLAKSIGVGNIIMDNVDLRFNCSIGDGNIILTRTVIAHETVVGNFNYFAGSNHINGKNYIGNNNFLGTNCMMADSGYMGDYNLIGSGVALGKKIDSHMMVASAPVRVRKVNSRAMDIILLNR